MENCLPTALIPRAPAKLTVLNLSVPSRAIVGISMLLAPLGITVALFQSDHPTLTTLLHPLKHSCVIFQL